MARAIGTAPSLLECRATARRRHVVVPDRDPEAGDPIQYDEVRIEHDHGDVEIVVYNGAILLFRTDSEVPRLWTGQYAGPAWPSRFKLILGGSSGSGAESPVAVPGV